MRSADDERRQFRRRLRHEQTEAERRLWCGLRDRRLAGFKFVRQESIGPYIADFFCREAKLIVEVDGSQHADSTDDAARDARLSIVGYRVLRFWNAEVSNNIVGVLDTIFAALPASPRLWGEGRDDLVVGATSPQGDGEGPSTREAPPDAPLTPGCRLASATTRSPKPSSRVRGEGEILDDRLTRSDSTNPRRGASAPWPAARKSVARRPDVVPRRRPGGTSVQSGR
ncbi:endonuclease domain-containing protein [Methylorubrum populi]